MIYKDPWKILGIEPTRDVKEIKRAYSSLAKKTNPEDDPDGFRELHDAYKAALALSKTIPIKEAPKPASETSPGSAPKPEDDTKLSFDYSGVGTAAGHDRKDPHEDEAKEVSFDYSGVDLKAKHEKPEEKKEEPYDYSDVDTKAKHEIPRKEPEESYDFSGVDLKAKHEKPEENKEGPREEEKGSFDPDARLDETSEEQDKEEESPDRFDYTGIDLNKIDSDPAMIFRDNIDVFRKRNRLEHYENIIRFKPDDRRRLLQDLMTLYYRMAMGTHDPSVWAEMFDEPLFLFFEGDPDFISRVSEMAFNYPKQHRDAIKRELAAQNGIPNAVRWQPAEKAKRLRESAGGNKGAVFGIGAALLVFLLLFLTGKFVDLLQVWLSS